MGDAVPPVQPSRPTVWRRTVSSAKATVSLLGQRVLEHVALEFAVYAGVRVLRAYASEESLLKLVRASAPQLVVGGGAGIAYWVVSSQNDSGGCTISAEVDEQVEACQDPIGHVPPVAACVVELAACGISQWLVHDVIGLWQPRMGDLEVVPLSGRIRQRLPKRTLQDLELNEMESEETIVVEGLQGGPVQVQTWVKSGLNATVRVAERMAREVYGPDVAILEPSDPSSQLLVRLVHESLLAFVELLDLRCGGSQQSLTAETLAQVLGPNRGVGVQFVDARAPTGLRFAVTRRPAAQGGGRVVTSRVARARQPHLGGESLYVGGVTRLLSVVLERGTAYSQPKTAEEQELLVGFLASTAAHETVHLMSRHTSEDVHFYTQRGLVQLVRLAANAFLRLPVRKVTAAALGIQAMPAAGCSTPTVLSMLDTAYLELVVETIRQVAALGDPVMDLAQQGTSNMGLFARRLIHELEAEQGAMLLLARMGHSPTVMLRSRSSATAYMIEQGGGDLIQGLKKLQAVPASELRVSEEDMVSQWPDAPKVAWALAQVFFEAQAAYLDAVRKKEASN